MPTYSYACSECAHRFDATQSIHDDALTSCPLCAAEVRRVISAVGVTFKGSGFYRTDSRKSGTLKATPKATPATSAAADPA